MTDESVQKSEAEKAAAEAEPSDASGPAMAAQIEALVAKAQVIVQTLGEKNDTDSCLALPVCWTAATAGWSTGAV